MTLFMMARKETELLFPKSGIKGIQGKNLFFNNAGNDGCPVVFSFPDIADPSQQVRARHRHERTPSKEDWRSKSDKDVLLMSIMIFSIQMMRVPGTPWFASAETIEELKILPDRHVIILPNDVLTQVFKDTKTTAKKNAVFVKIKKVNHKGRHQGYEVTAIFEDSNF